MRQKIALIIALAGFAVVTAFGVGMAGADRSAGLGENRAANGIVSGPALPSAELPACSNELDDDEDGLVDADDPDCESPADPSEEPEPAAAEEPEQSESPVQPKRGGKVESGDALDAAEAPEAEPRGVKRNESIGGGAQSGGVVAPKATAGDQPPDDGPDGGSQFDSGGAPTAANPSTTFAPFGPAPIGVPNFVIDSFEIPPFLLPIYQACGTEYGIPWQVLASINKIETAFGTNLNVSSAGAMGWMQFIPSSWEMYGL
ncbi:MAG TPA: hypothetical protein VFT19_08845, partial [Solirubrobacterales bacterium]|nr:hypothetical protein [Solirubrobacterales bacterium]